MAIPCPWKNEISTSCPKSFNQEYPTEFRASEIAGTGYFALVDIPKNTRLRQVAVDNGTLYRFSSEAGLKEAGWDIDDAVNYGIAHKNEPNKVFFLNPGTACNHADPSREVSIAYNMSTPGIMEIWTVRDVKAGEEMLCDYSEDYKECPWFDKLCRDRGVTPLCDLAREVEIMLGFHSEKGEQLPAAYFRQDQLVVA